jgi:hypothetical protein
MRRLKIVGLAFFAVLALGVITAEAASAASTVLPEFSKEVAGHATSGTATLNFEATKVSCPLAESLFGALSKTLGTFKISFDQCAAGAESCHSLGQALGSLTIEATGEYHLVSRASDRTFYMLWLLFAATDSTAALHIECEAPAVGLILFWGNVLGQIKAAPAGSEETFELIFKSEGGGKTVKQELNRYGNNSGTEITVQGIHGKLGTGVERNASLTAESNLLHMLAPTSLEES